MIVAREENKNVVIISEAEYNELAKAKRIAEYPAKSDKSFKQLEDGKTISFRNCRKITYAISSE